MNGLSLATRGYVGSVTRSLQDTLIPTIRRSEDERPVVRAGRLLHAHHHDQIDLGLWCCLNRDDYSFKSSSPWLPYM